MALLPLPHQWSRAVELLAPLGARASLGASISAQELLDAALCAYDVELDDVAPLLAWASR
jgi:hypothetical protein